MVGNGIVFVINAAGIYKNKGMLLPLYPGVMAIPGNPGGRIYNGVTALCNPVKEGRFTHIGTADQGDQRLRVVFQNSV